MVEDDTSLIGQAADAAAGGGIRTPAPACFIVQGRDGGRPLTCDADSPILTARARRGPAVPDTARTQCGPRRGAPRACQPPAGRGERVLPLPLTAIKQRLRQPAPGLAEPAEHTEWSKRCASSFWIAGVSDRDDLWNLEALARRVTLVLVWRSSMSHSLSDGCGYCLTRVGACCPA